MEELSEKITQAKINNKGLTPYIDMDYWCETCGSKTGECHPVTGYCFICDSDNWEPYNHRNL